MDAEMLRNVLTMLGTVLGVAIPLLTAGLRPLPVRVRKPGMVLQLAFTVVVDTTRSNIAVARLLLAPGSRRHPAAVLAAFGGRHQEILGFAEVL